MHHVTHKRLQCLRKTQTHTHTRARKRRQHREWIQCLVQLRQKWRHVTKWEFHLVWEMSLKCCRIDNVLCFPYGGKQNNAITGICEHLRARTHTHTRVTFSIRTSSHNPPSVHHSRKSTTYHAHPYFPASIVHKYVTCSTSYSPQSHILRGTSRCWFWDKYKTHEYNVGRAYSCWMLILLVHHITSRL
jgi:hypothetical protein